MCEKALVTLVNPNKVKPGVTPYALDVLSTHLEQACFDVEVVDLTFKGEVWKDVVRDYFSSREPILVGFTIRNTETVQPQEQRVFLEEHLEIIKEIKQFTQAPIIAGGAGFSSMPHALLEYLDIPYGVKGPGELILCNLAQTIVRNKSPKDIPGLLIYDGQNVEEVPERSDKPQKRFSTRKLEIGNDGIVYMRRSGVPWKVDNQEYYRNGGLGNFLATNGCPLNCAHCSEPDAKGRNISKRTASSVVDELELLTGQGIYDIHSADSEFNLEIDHSKKILKEIIARKGKNSSSPLHNLCLWLYCQPMPFDEEFAVLLSEAGCKGVCVGTDHTCQELLDSWKTTQSGRCFYTFDDVKRTNQLLQQNNILVTNEIILGMPGETIETLRKCIDDSLALNSTVVGYTLGLKVFPYTPLGMRLAAESDGNKIIKGLQSNTAISPIKLKPLHKCRSAAEYERQFMIDEYNRLRPVFYFSPDLPEDPESIESPSGRWVNTILFMWEYIPKEEHYRVALPTPSGDTKDDNNYADNLFLMCFVKLGYQGAYYSKWRQRDQIIQEAIDKGIVSVQQNGAILNK